MISKLLAQIRQRKFTAGIVLLVIIGGGYVVSQNVSGSDGPIQYVTATVEQGTLVLSISGSGQVSVSDQIDITPKASGEVISVNVQKGQEVVAGTLIAQLDTKEAEKSVRDAKVNLESARLTLDKIKLQQKQQIRGDALNTSYEDGLSVLASLYDEFGTILNALDDILLNTDLSEGSQINIEFYADANNDIVVASRTQRLYKEIESVYEQSLLDYQLAERGSGETRQEAIQTGYELTVKTAEIIKTGRDTIRYFQDTILGDNSVHSKQTIINSHESDLTDYALSMDDYLGNLLAIVNTINNNRNAVEAYPTDIQSQELTIKQREYALLDAQEKLDDYSVRAPANGIVAEISIKKGNSVSLSQVAAILISTQKLAEISLNEIDITKVEVGQLVTLTFDAVEDVTLTGRVTEIDSLGAVTQGVVTYGVKIAFDTQDERIKPGMTIDASIITERKDSIVLVPNAAVQAQSGQVFVEVMQSETPQSIPVEVGLSNELFTEIVSGLQEGDEVVTARLGGEGSTQTANASQSFRIPGLGGGGGGFRGGGGFVPHN